MSVRAVNVREDAFQQQVIDLAHIYGWRVAHFRPARTEQGWRTPVAADGAGFPDLVLVRGAELLFAELKGARGRLSGEQRVWLHDLQQISKGIDRMVGMNVGDGVAPRACVEVFIWRPDDFDEINLRLRRPVGRLAA